MFMALNWSTVLRDCVCGTPPPPSLELLLNDVRLGYWHFMNPVCLVVYSLISTSMFYDWLLCWICDVLWIRALCKFLLCLDDQVLVLDL